MVFVTRLQTLDQDEGEEFANLVKEFAGAVDPYDYVDFDKNIASSMTTVDMGSISWRQEILNEIIGKHENPADEVMGVSSNEDVDEESKDPERIKSASDALQLMDKAIRFSHEFDNEELRVKIIESLQELQILRRRQRKMTAFFTKK